MKNRRKIFHWEIETFISSPNYQYFIVKFNRKTHPYCFIWSFIVGRHINASHFLLFWS